MGVKVFSLPLLIGLFLFVAPLLFSEAKATIGTEEGQSPNKTMADEVQAAVAHMKETIRKNKLSRSQPTCPYKDKYWDCWRWVNPYCETGRWVDWMKENCPVSCGRCGCIDIYPSGDCMYWASRGLCSRSSTSHTNFMQLYCRRSCNSCSSCKCGQANSGIRNKIVGGVETLPHEYPWQVQIFMKIGNEYGECGGSIISNKGILTAAHCVWNQVTNKQIPKEDILVLVGQHDIGEVDNDELFQNPPMGKGFRVCEEAKVHESYDDSNLDYDFAILTLCGELEFDETVSPVCLPKWDRYSFYNDPSAIISNNGLDNIISGWGRLFDNGPQPDKLQKLTVQTISNEECSREVFPEPLTERMMCGKAAGKNGCRGDSGGPWVTKSERNYVLTGVTSWTPLVNGDHCVPGKPAVAARVTNQLDWIKANMKGETCPRDPRPL